MLWHEASQNATNEFHLILVSRLYKAHCSSLRVSVELEIVKSVLHTNACRRLCFITYCNVWSQNRFFWKFIKSTCPSARALRIKMPTENLSDKRMSKFKNKGKEPTVSCASIIFSFFHYSNFHLLIFTPYLCLQKMRDRRVAECVELRKAQRVEGIMKRRNITSLGDEEPLSPEFNTDNEQVFTDIFKLELKYLQYSYNSLFLH